MPILESHCTVTDEDIQRFRLRAANNIRFLRATNGDIVGRAFITVGYGHHGQHLDLSGVVTVGGLAACSLSGIAGVLTGVPMRASRDAAKPVVDADELKRWAEEQSHLVPALWEDAESQAACAKYIRLCGGDTGELPICRNGGRWCSASEIRSRTDVPDSIVLLDDFAVDFHLQHLDSYTLNENVFVVGTSGIPGLLQCRVRWPKDTNTDFTWSGGSLPLTLGGAVVEAIAQAWGVDVQAVNRSSQVQKESQVTIGSTDKGDLKERAIVICRPLDGDSSNKAVNRTP
jgi:hypothetical protein